MALYIFFAFTIAFQPKIETLEVSFYNNSQISLIEGSLVFINTNSFTSDDFIFQFKKEKAINDSDTKAFAYNDSTFSINNSFLSPETNVHWIFERKLCGDYITIIPNIQKLKRKKAYQINETSFLIHFWRIPDELCDLNAYVVKSNNVMSIVPRSRSFSRFCFFSSLNFSHKFSYKVNFHATGSLLGWNSFKNHDSNLKDNLGNFMVELFESGNSSRSLLQSNYDIKLSRPFLMLGSYDDLNIGKLLINFAADDNDCSAIPIQKYHIGQIKSKTYFSKLQPPNKNVSNDYFNKIKHESECKNNTNLFSYSTLFMPLLSLSTVSTDIKNWKRIDVKCIEKGNDADAGFISLVVILLGMVIFVLLNAKKFVILDCNDFAENPRRPVEDNEIHLDIEEISS